MVYLGIMFDDKYQGKYRVNSSRLEGFDYSSGVFFITICVKGMERVFGEVVFETHNCASVRLSKLGDIVQEYWQSIPDHFPQVVLDEFVVMPDHVHGVLRVVETHNYASVPCENQFGPQSRNLASIIRGFKSSVKRWANVNDYDFEWQPRYYEKIIRSQKALESIRQYIKDNPKNYK